jgi:hypothetical protein
MPEFCTCGAQLPPDALFCHKCGKPQREISEPEVEPAPPPLTAAPLPPPVSLPLNFQNRVAVRIAFIVAVSATIMSFIPFLNWAAAGFFAVFLYRRRTGSFLNVGAGAQLGLMTGVLMCGFFAIVFTAQQLPAALNGRLGSLLQEQLKNLPSKDPLVQQMTSFIQSGPGLAAVLVASLLMMFLMIICLSMAGGALGAKMVGRQ